MFVGLNVLAMAGAREQSEVIMVAENGNVRRVSYSARYQRITFSVEQGQVDSRQQVIGYGNFSRSDSRDIMTKYDNGTNVVVRMWLMRAPGVRIGNVVIGALPTGFTEGFGTHDVDADGDLELMLQNPTTGQVKGYEITKVAGEYVWGDKFDYGVPGATGDWKAVGVFDMDNDGQMDIVLQNPTTLEIQYRYYNGTMPQSLSAVVAEVPSSNISAVMPNEVVGSATFLMTPLNPDGVRGMWRMTNTTRTRNKKITSAVFGGKTLRSWGVFAVQPYN